MKKIVLLSLLFMPCLIQAKQPNVIIIITDDHGYGDIAAHGNPVIKTPGLDKLHSESLRFTNFHVDPTCAPTRGALMSGKYSHRARVWHTILGGNSMRAGQTIMPELFKNSGYNTVMFGKWHLGANYPYRPIDRGFDEWLGSGNGGTGTTDDYFTNDRVNDHYLHNGEWEYHEGFAPDVFFGAARKFIKTKGKEKPFFMYLATYVPHGPYTLPDQDLTTAYQQELTEKFGEIQAKKIAYYYASIGVVDKNVGLLRQTLKEEGLDKDTILIFMSDNGATSGRVVFNAGMKGGKGSVSDGGHRVPFFIHWPAGNIQHGSDVPALNAHFDVLPTLVDLLDLEVPNKLDIDGRSFKKQLFTPQLELPARTLFVETQRTVLPEKWSKTVAMTKRWRLIDNKNLYDIKADPGQEKNLFAEYPEVVQQLREDFENYWEHVSPNDREATVTTIGHPNDKETFLSSEDWYVKGAAWNHGTASRGSKVYGPWFVKAHTKGRYQFELRRWPEEVDTPISGVPILDKSVDAWDEKGAKPTLIYSGEKNPFKALPVKFMKLTMGSLSKIIAIDDKTTHSLFEFELENQQYELKAEMLDGNKKVIAGAYYVYCRKL
ncbi:arylsulfatase [Lentisphaera profundi]|uniref:Arylsulfatase n=1 Tax=Lentisphaera profundi TaxID=1658616 RepID=A0ABY7W044_9BACT|nr:arylsulfatase [Lentisphaera profundi]WDE98487.1 arylsulfatase [Lentisphaera profundi]